jgi:hypothetical protein
MQFLINMQVINNLFCNKIKLNGSDFKNMLKCIALTKIVL